MTAKRPGHDHGSVNRNDEQMRLHSIDPFPGVSHNPISPFQRDYKPGKAPARLWPIAASIGGLGLFILAIVLFAP